MVKILKKFTIKQIIFFGVVFLVALFTRFYLIETIPPFVAHDELGYLLNAQAVSLSGKDITGTWNPLSLTPVTPTLSELTTHLIVPFYLLKFINPILAGKLIFIIMSLIVPFLIAGIAFEFTKSRRVAAFTWFLSLFNPWIWQQGRMSFDPYASFFFYILGAYLLLSLKHWKKLLAIVPLFIGFYQYQGHKIAFLFWVFFFFVYSISSVAPASKNIINKIRKIDVKKIAPQLIVLVFSIVLFTAYLVFQLPGQKSKDRLTTLFTPSSSEIVLAVNEQRRLSFNTPLNSLFVNKYTVWASEILKRLTETYSYNFLFIEGQVSNSSWSVWNHGIFYSIDFILIIFGVIYLIIAKRHKFLVLLVFGLLTIILPSLIAANEAYFFRSSLNIPILLIIAALGAEFIYKRYPRIVIVLALIYFVSIAHFAYLYFVRYPIIAANKQFFSDRILAEYLKRVPTTQKVVVYSPEPEFSISTYLFFNEYLNAQNIYEVQQQYQKQEFSINTLAFVGDCLPQNVAQASELVISRHDVRDCNADEASILTITQSETQSDAKNKNQNSVQIQAIQDSGTYFYIFNDTVCSNTSLNSYVTINSLKQLEFENMNNEEFCKTWISKLIEN